MSLYFLIGSIVGLVLTLTGSGGAILAIPMLIHGGGLSLSTSTILALPIVGVSALVPLLLRVHKPQWGILLGVVLGALPSSYAMAFVKPFVPAGVILTTLILLSVWALYQVWRPETQNETRLPQDSIGRRLLIGVLSGILTTLTGLGGGIVLVPLLRQGLGLSLCAASATSLGIILVNVTAAFAMQYRVIASDVHWQNMVLLFIGVLCANGTAGFLFRKCSIPCRDKLKQIVFSVVIIVSLALLIH